ncbi:MAG TPA: hypothetical protein VF032_19595 [Thermoleophilaceae bacterium]
MTTEQNPPAEPTQQDAIKSGQEATSAALAAAEGSTSEEEARSRAESAARDKLKESGLPLTAEQVEMLGKQVSDFVIKDMETRGAFDPPPEPVSPPPAAAESTAPPAPGEEPTPPPQPEPAPRKRTLAERFLNG